MSGSILVEITSFFYLNKLSQFKDERGKGESMGKRTEVAAAATNARYATLLIIDKILMLSSLVLRL